MSGLNPVDSRAASLHRGTVRGEHSEEADRIRSTLDWRAVCAAVELSNILRLHALDTCRRTAARDLADVNAADGLACHALSNVAHRRAGLWLTTWTRFTLDDEAGAQS